MALEYAKLDHSDVVNRFEVSRQTVSRWCHDIGPAPKRFVLDEFARMCRVSPEWLIGTATPPPARTKARDSDIQSRLTESNRRPIHYE